MNEAFQRPRASGIYKSAAMEGLKRIVDKIFSLCCFFHPTHPLTPLIYNLKHFRKWRRIRRDILPFNWPKTLQGDDLAVSLTSLGHYKSTFQTSKDFPFFKRDM
jgi:hypothetical protein